MNSAVGTSPHDRSDYIGPAWISVGGTEVEVEVELRGYREPIDGVFRWIGRVAPNEELSAVLGEEPRTTATIRTTHSTQTATIGDCDPWGRFRITGKSTPPFAVATELDQIKD